DVCSSDLKKLPVHARSSGIEQPLGLRTWRPIWASDGPLCRPARWLLFFLESRTAVAPEPADSINDSSQDSNQPEVLQTPSRALRARVLQLPTAIPRRGIRWSLRRAQYPIVSRQTWVAINLPRLSEERRPRQQLPQM